MTNNKPKNKSKKKKLLTTSAVTVFSAGRICNNFSDNVMVILPPRR